MSAVQVPLVAHRLVHVQPLVQCVAALRRVASFIVEKVRRFRLLRPPLVPAAELPLAHTLRSAKHAYNCCGVLSA